MEPCLGTDKELSDSILKVELANVKNLNVSIYQKEIPLQESTMSTTDDRTLLTFYSPQQRVQIPNTCHVITVQRFQWAMSFVRRTFPTSILLVHWKSWTPKQTVA
jgi:hypothetical protein